ncbi:MAG: hypothetical protein ACKVGZ_21045, partial [Alphaproteobacteria bacterium]
MRTHSYEGQRFVQELPPEALTLNPPDMVVALVNATDVRMQRTPWVWRNFILYSLFLVGFAVVFIFDLGTSRNNDWITIALYVAPPLGWLGWLTYLIRRRKHWRISV